MTFTKYQIKDNAYWQLLSWISAVATTITLKTGNGTRFPTITSGSTPASILTLIKVDWSWNVLQSEQVLCTNRTADTLTVTRWFNSTTAQAFASDDYIYLYVTASVTQDIQDEIESLWLTKLNITDFNSSKRTNLTANKILFVNSAGDETEVALWANNTYLKSTGATWTPVFDTPPLDINGQTAISTASNSNTLPIYDWSWTKKISLEDLVNSIYSYDFAYWDWSDGDVTISSWTTTLTRDMYYNNLTVSSWAILDPNWYRIFVKWTFGWSWTIRRNWNNASWQTAWATLNQWTLNAEKNAWNWWNWWSNGYWSNGITWEGSNPSLHNVNGVAWWAGWPWPWWVWWTSAGWTATRWNDYNKLLWLSSLIHIACWSFTNNQYWWIPWSWWWGWGWWSSIWWNWWWAWSNWGLIWICSKFWNFMGVIEQKWWNWANWWNASTPFGGSWSWWGGWGWGWSWWITVRIYRKLIADCTFTQTWWTAWTWWAWILSWSAGSVGTAWATWTTITMTL